MMKYNYNSYFYLLVIACLTILSCSAPIKSGIIDYDIHFAPNEAGIPMEEAFSKSARVYFNADYLKLVKEEEQGLEEFTITTLKSDKEMTYLSVMDRKFAVIFDKKYLPEIGPLKLTDEYKMIAGYKCQKVVAPMGSGTMHLYITKKISPAYAPYVDVNGFALEYSLAMSYGQVTYTAQRIEKNKLSNQDILPTSNYEEVTIAGFNDFMMSAIGGGERTGDEALDFEKESLTGELIHLSDFKDQVVVLNFWFTTCAPCKAEIPFLNELKTELAQEKVNFIAITFDSQSKVEEFLQKHPFNFIQIADAFDLSNAYKVRAFPTTLILDKNGNIAHQKIGGSPNIKEELKSLILQELKK